jgi:hypothetical protein
MAHISVYDTIDSLSSENARLRETNKELLEALKELVARCDGDEGIRADGSNIQTARAHAILEKLEGAN